MDNDGVESRHQDISGQKTLIQETTIPLECLQRIALMSLYSYTAMKQTWKKVMKFSLAKSLWNKIS